MVYTVYELLWFFFLYSFLGWCSEVCVAAVRHKRFINRGVVNSPLCPIYGVGAVGYALFLPELSENLFFLFLGGLILGSLTEFFAGVLLEKIFHRKWWDYSRVRFNLEGYICLPGSLLWGACAVLAILFVNPLFIRLLGHLPHRLGVILLAVMGGLLFVDGVGTALTILGMQKKMKQVSELSEEIGQISTLLENAITRKITRRMERAFPTLELRKRIQKTEESTVFAPGCSFFKLVCLFFIGSFLGDITETIYCYLVSGELMSRSSVVYGPFSIVWGLGCACLTVVLYRIKDKGDSHLFVAGMLLGGAYEYICSVFTERVFGTVFWDYSEFRFNLGGRINLLYCFFWGIAAVVWMKLLYPFFSKWIEKLPKKGGTILCLVILVFMIFDCTVSSLALVRYVERNTAIDAWTAQKESSELTQLEEELDKNALTDFMDTHFDDQRMERIYPNAKMVDK